jgi:hypothetical protein
MRSPDKEGKWRAWEVRLTSEERAACPAQLGDWVVHAPGVHPFWSWWRVSLIHLRDIPGQPPAQRQYPEAEYELLSIALDPACVVDPDDVTTQKWLQPIDFSIQFYGLSDDSARYLLTLLIDGVVSGHLHPDTDFERSWRGAISATIEHLTGGHPQGSA